MMCISKMITKPTEYRKLITVSDLAVNWAGRILGKACVNVTLASHEVKVAHSGRKPMFIYFFFYSYDLFDCESKASLGSVATVLNLLSGAQKKHGNIPRPRPFGLLLLC